MRKLIAEHSTFEQVMGREDHPVWEVYDLHRLSRLRIKYYCAQLERTQQLNTALEIFLAATVSGSAVGTLAFWSSTTGRVGWQILAAISAILAVGKPIFAFTSKIQKAEEVVTGYRLIEQRLARLESSIRNDRGYGQPHQRRFAAIMEDLDAVVLKQPMGGESAELIAKFTEEVVRELPSSDFFVPEE